MPRVSRQPLGSTEEVLPRRFVSFDGTETAVGAFARPDRYRHLFDLLKRRSPAIPRGAGLSYCSASAGRDVLSVSTLLFDRVLAFDAERGSIVVEPGVTVADLFGIAVGRGWYPPVLPGYPSITIGGCVAFDVHGKSGGCFRSCVTELVVFHPALGEVRCSREQDPELFELTIGGFGLTGFVTSVRLQLVPLPGRSLRRRRLPVGSLFEAAEVLSRFESSHDFAYSWNDLSVNGSAFGRGTVYLETFDPRPIDGRPGARRMSPEARRSLRLPLLNRHTTRPFNRLYHRLETLRGDDHLPLERGAFPIAGKELYFTLFGTRGFREYQLLLPRDRFDSAAEEIRQAVQASRARCCLGSLKLLAATPGMLRFSGRGVAIAIDVPADEAARPLFSALDDIAVRYGGLVNLSKDSRLSGDVVRELFPGYEEFRAGLRAINGERAFDSALRSRVLA